MKVIHIKSSSSLATDRSFSVSSRPDSTLLKDNKPFFIPDFTDEIAYELNLVFRVNRLGKNIAKRFAHRYYDAVTVGVALKDIKGEQKLKEVGSPLDLSTGFDGSSILGSFIDIDSLDDSENIACKLVVDEHVHQFSSRELAASIEEIIAFLSKYYTLKIGDLIFVGVDDQDNLGKIHIGQNFRGYIEGSNLLSLKIC